LLTPCFLSSRSDGSERRQVVVHPPRGRCLGFAAVPEDHACRGFRAPLPTERRGGGPSVALRRSGSGGRGGTRRGPEAQRQQLELGQVIGEWDQSRGRAAEAESRAEALGDQLAKASARAGALAADLAMAQAASSEQRARAEGMSWLFEDFDSASFFNSCLKTSALAVCRARVCPR
jgi:hypothetical protein